MVDLVIVAPGGAVLYNSIIQAECLLGELITLSVPNWGEIHAVVRTIRVPSLAPFTPQVLAEICLPEVQGLVIEWPEGPIRVQFQSRKAS